MRNYYRKWQFRSRFRIAIVSVVVLAVLQFFGVFTHLFEKDYYTEFTYPYNGDVRNSVRKLRLGQIPDIRPINFYNHTFLKSCHDKCESETELHLVFIIRSNPERFERRQVIRKTWGYEHHFSDAEVRRVFVLGTRDNLKLQRNIDKEAKLEGDIIQGDFTDSYYNTTIKMMTGMTWAIKFCTKSHFYMFVDDDYYVSAKNVLRFVWNPTNYPQYLMQPLFASKRVTQDVRLYAGYVIFSSPHRHYTGTWSVSLDEYPFHKWPPYITGGAYVLSREALLEMYYTSFYTKHFKFDDIYLAFIAMKAGIGRFHCSEFYFHKKQYYLPQDYKFVIASHGYSDPEELWDVWNEQKRLGNA